MKSRRINRFLNIHAVINHVHDRVNNGGDDVTATGCPDHHHQLAIPIHNRRAHRTQRPLAWRNCVGFALHKAIGVRHTELHGEVIHFIVEQHTRSRRRDACAEPAVQCVCHGHRIAVFIDDRIVRRVAALMRCGTGLQLHRHARFHRIDRGANARGIGFVEEARQRIFHEIGIAQIGISVQISVAHRLYLQMNRCSRTKAHFFQRIAFDDIQNLADDDAT